LVVAVVEQLIALGLTASRINALELVLAESKKGGAKKGGGSTQEKGMRVKKRGKLDGRGVN